MSTATKPILDLDTLAPDRPVVRIKSKDHRRGKHYEIATLEDLSLKERAILGQLQRRIQTLDSELGSLRGESEEIPDDGVLDQFEQVIDQFLGLVIVGLPTEIVDELKLSQKEALMGAFMEASPPATQKAIEAAMSEAAKATPAK